MEGMGILYDEKIIGRSIRVMGRVRKQSSIKRR